MQRTRNILLAPANSSANCVCAAQEPGGAGNLLINGSLATNGVATFDIQRRPRVTTNANESANTITIYGTNSYGIAISEAQPGANNSTTDYTKDFLTITRVAISGAASANITVGSGPVLSSPWFPADRYGDISTGFNVHIVKGTNITYSVEFTNDEPFQAVNPNPTPDIYLQPVKHPVVHDRTADAAGYFDFAFTAFRLTITAYDNSSSATVSAWFNPGSP